MKVFVLRAAMAALVLALGIAVGAGPLQEDHDRRARELAAQQAQVADLERQVAELNRSARFSTAYAEATGRRLVGGALNRRTVAVVALPGADPVTVAAFRTLIAAAGGEITADVQLAEPLVDPAQRQLVSALTSQMASQEDLAMPAGGSGYARFGTLLARAIAIPSSATSRDAPYDETGIGIVSGFEIADLVGSTTEVSRRATVTLMVAGPDRDQQDGRTDVLASLVRAYAVRARVVVAGPAPSAEAEGVLGILRGSGTPDALFSTVDSVEFAGARVSAILALAARFRGTLGSYGGEDAADGAIPPQR